MIIDSVRDFIKTCPFLKNGKINANYLGEKAVRYTIDNVPTSPIIRKYVDGGSQRQFLFVFASREFYGPEELENFNVSGFYEQFANWIEEQNDAGNLPVLGAGLKAQGIEALTGGYLYDTNTGDARYQIQCRLIYYKGV